MMYFKVPLDHKKQGFVFIEVVIAILLVGFVLTSLLALQAQVFKRVIINAFRVDRFYPLKNMLITDVMRAEESVQKQEETLGLKMVYARQEIKPISALYRFKGLYQKQATGTWIEQEREKIQQCISYGFEIKKEKNT